ncbi:MAG: hypothetical protein LBC69_01155, partial [Eubacteriaceae bacterium]|nr:hypothetical protein [Eubacteriaceae bacterium]
MFVASKQAAAAACLVLCVAMFSSCGTASLTVIEPESPQMLFVGVKRTEYVFTFEEAAVSS